MFDDFTQSFSQERKSLGSKKTPKPRSRPSGSSKIGRAKSEGSVRNHKDYDPYWLPDDDEELDEVGACCFPALSTLFFVFEQQAEPTKGQDHWSVSEVPLDFLKYLYVMPAVRVFPGTKHISAGIAITLVSEH